MIKICVMKKEIVNGEILPMKSWSNLFITDVDTVERKFVVTSGFN